LAKFVDIYAYFSTSTPLILGVIALNINYQRSKLGYQRKTNSTLRHSSSQSAKISGFTLKQGSETHSSLRQSNLQEQYQALLRSVKYEQLSIEGVRLDWLAHTLVCKIEFC